jgi:ATP-dependent Zn protease
MPISSKNKSLVIWLIVVLVAFLILSVGARTAPPSTERVSYTRILQVVAAADASNTDASIVIQGNTWELKVEDKTYTTIAPLTDKTIEDLSKHKGLEVRFKEPEKPSIWLNIFITWLPFIIIFYFVYRFFKNSPKGAWNRQHEV